MPQLPVRGNEEWQSRQQQSYATWRSSSHDSRPSTLPSFIGHSLEPPQWTMYGTSRGSAHISHLDDTQLRPAAGHPRSAITPMHSGTMHSSGQGITLVWIALDQPPAPPLNPQQASSQVVPGQVNAPSNPESYIRKSENLKTALRRRMRYIMNRGEHSTATIPFRSTYSDRRTTVRTTGL